jgi:hypothetical protein
MKAHFLSVAEKLKHQPSADFLGFGIKKVQQQSVMFYFSGMFRNRLKKAVPSKHGGLLPESVLLHSTVHLQASAHIIKIIKNMISQVMQLPKL